MIAFCQNHSVTQNPLYLLTSQEMSKMVMPSRHLTITHSDSTRLINFTSDANSIKEGEINYRPLSDICKEQLDNSRSTQQNPISNPEDDQYDYSQALKKEIATDKMSSKKIIQQDLWDLQLGNYTNNGYSKISKYWQYNGVFNNCLLLNLGPDQNDDNFQEIVVSKEDLKIDAAAQKSSNKKNLSEETLSNSIQNQIFLNYLLSDEYLAQCHKSTDSKIQQSQVFVCHYQQQSRDQNKSQLGTELQNTTQYQIIRL